MEPKDTLLTTKAFARRSGLSVEQVTRMLRAKELTGHKQSGRWMIPADQLAAAGGAPEPGPPRPAAPAKAEKTSPAPQGLTISEFSARTYLTEAGVLQWLKRGRLRGTQAPGGDWLIDAASLELPCVRHLQRS